jgi:signal transduction histidine kinase
VPSSTFRHSHRAFAPAIALFGAVVVGAAGLFGALYEDQLYRNQTRNEVTVQARILAASLTAALSFNDNNTARQYTNAFQANPELDAVVVYDEHGKVITQFLRRGARPPSPETAVGAARFAGDHVEIFVPVVERGQRFGTVYLSASVDPLEWRVLKYGFIALIAATAALLLAVLGAAQRTLSNVNRQLEVQARNLSEANTYLEDEMRERARIEEALRQSQKMEAVGQLSGGIAHDFNNFLMIIKGNLTLLKRRMALGNTDVTRYVDNAMEGVERAVVVTQRVLAFSRRQPLTPEVNNLSELVRETLLLVRQSVDGRIEIETRLDADWFVYCDTNQMENVILNLAINARDAMPDGGRLEITTKNVTVEVGQRDYADAAPGEYVELVVHDTGIGMTEEVRAKALDPFFTTKPHGKGTGLGLSTTFGYIRQSAGYLDIESAVGKGTRIRILMPRRFVETVSKSA